eukprot:963330-Amphidinium_carterae.1
MRISWEEASKRDSKVAALGASLPVVDPYSTMRVKSNDLSLASQVWVTHLWTGAKESLFPPTETDTHACCMHATLDDRACDRSHGSLELLGSPSQQHEQVAC